MLFLHNKSFFMKTIIEPAKQTPVRAEVDILVVGGGPSGFAAAYSAASSGLKVMVLESRGYLGGNLTIGLPILSYIDCNGVQNIKGTAQLLIDRLAAKGAASGHKRCKLHSSLTIIDSEAVKTEIADMLTEKGVDLLYYAFCVGAIVEEGAIKGVIIESKAGREAILAKQVIDCTGDGDVAFRAGVPFSKGDKDGGLQPPTLMFQMKGVNIQALRDAIVKNPADFDMDTMPKEQFIEGKFITVGLRQRIKMAQADGIDIPVARTILITGLADDEIWVNMTRVSGTDSTLPESYTRGEIIARKQMEQIVKYLHGYVPGFENAFVQTVAPFMGIRESRVIKGEYIVTAEDLLSAKRHEDCIAVASYPVDIHHSTGGDCTMVFLKDNYDLPYRCLLPTNVENLLVAGRCSSMNHEAMAATRVMSTCMALGQAAGVAARVAVENGTTAHGVDVAKVREILLEEGAFLG